MNRIFLSFFMLVLGISSLRAGNSTVRIDQDQPLARKCLGRALLCLASYDSDGDAQVLGWDGPDIHYGGCNLKDDFTGLYAAVYERSDTTGKKDVVMAFRGSDEKIDWTADLENFIGLVPDVYSEAATFAQTASSLAEKNDAASFCLTGHSLGGALASYCALLLDRDATCFGSAAIGNGLQKVLWNEAPPHLNSTILQVFKEDDIVPIVTAKTGKHYGTIALPKLQSPANYSKKKSDEEKLGFLAVTGFITHKWMRSGKEVALAKIMEGHGIDQYVAAIANLISPVDHFSPAGEWLSKGSFFDVSSTETRFRFCQNGHFKVINDFKFFEVVGKKTNDSGTWSFNAPDLQMTIPGLVRMTYRLTSGDGIHVAVWRRVSMEPDSITQESNDRPKSKLAAITMELILRRMQGKSIDWQRTLPSAN